MTKFLVLGFLFTLILFSRGSNDTRITGGKNVVNISECPWHVSIQFHGHLCSGVIIAPRWVLTAASCVAGQSERLTKIHYGTIYVEGFGGTIIGTNRIILHPEFNRHNILNNIALIYTAETMNAPAALLAEKGDNLRKGEYIEISGWGMNEKGNIGVWPILQKVEIQVNRQEECKEAYKELNIPTINQGTFCIGNIANGGPSICNGDIGVPAYSRNDDKLYGIASFVGRYCGLGPNSPTVVTSVGEYREWISFATGI